VRRLVIVVSAIAVVETLLYSALAPLLPSFRQALGLSKAQAGLLVAMYAIGLSAAAVPLGLLAARIGVKGSAIAGLLMLAATSLAFGLVGSYWALLLTRFLEGVAGALCWASGIAWLVDVAPRQRRGEMIGIFSGASAGGAMLGPLVGGVAALAGRAGAFAGVAGFALLIAAASTRLPRPQPGVRQSLATIRRAHGSGKLLSAQWMVVLPGLLLGMIGLLAPLRFHRLGWGPAGIAATFLVAALSGLLARPVIGRWADRRGRLAAIRLLLLACVALTLLIPSVASPWLLAVVVVTAISTYGLLWGPAMALVSDRYEQEGIAQSLAFALMNLTAGVGVLVGSAAGGEIAHLAGDLSAYGLAATACLLSVTALTIPRRGAVRSAV
jgi:MFS family permease